MIGETRLLVAGLVLAGLLGGAALVGFAASACPVQLPQQPCPDAARNVTAVVVLGAGSVALLVTPFALLAEFVLRRRILYRGAWWRAARRGALAGLTVAALGGLRLAGTLSVPVVIFVLVMAVVVERFLASTDR